MTYYIIVENGEANRYKATVMGWPNCMAEGMTREEAIARVKQCFTERLNEVEIVPIELESTRQDIKTVTVEHPWAKFAGMYKANPLFDEVLDSIQAYRRELDEDETVIYRYLTLRAAKIRSGTQDFRITAIVLAIDGTLITRNLRDFAQVPERKIQD